MDLGSVGSEGPSPGFPRTRGDGPVSRTNARHVESFPPHARGWTRDRGHRRGQQSVSPARAGMDRTTTGWSRTTRRFPRTRGDGPIAIRCLLTSSRFPPHARGWTAKFQSSEQRAQVSPARAGMDPPPCTCKTRMGCFPRTRGDGPSCSPTPYRRDWFPPHARGWTSHRHDYLGDGGVSPARAGMDPPL